MADHEYHDGCSWLLRRRLAGCVGNLRTDRNKFKYDARPACRWIYGEDADCTWTEPGCCCSNPSMAYSVRWDSKGKKHEDIEWCLKWTYDGGAARCEWQELGEYAVRRG